VLPTYISSALHFIIIRPLVLITIIKRFQLSYLIVLICLIIFALVKNCDYYKNVSIDSYLVALYFYLSIIFFDIGIRFNLPARSLLKYVPHIIAAITGAQVTVLVFSYLNSDFSLYLVDKGIELTRISLGNALEVQITLTLLAYALQKNLKNKRMNLTLLILFFSNVIAQTRILIVCTFAMIFGSVFKFSIKWLFLVLALGIGVLLAIGEYFEIERFSIGDLISGGSTLDRLNLVFISLELIFSPEIIFGYGAGGFSNYYEIAFGTKKSVENAIIQVLIEFGIVGFFLLVLCIKRSINQIKNKQRIDPILIIILIQMTVMMPINAMLPIQAFLIGVIYASVDSPKCETRYK
jgi:hypothetical protein